MPKQLPLDAVLDVITQATVSDLQRSNYQMFEALAPRATARFIVKAQAGSDHWNLMVAVDTSARNDQLGYLDISGEIVTVDGAEVKKPLHVFDCRYFPDKPGSSLFFTKRGRSKTSG